MGQQSNLTATDLEEATGAGLTQDELSALGRIVDAAVRASHGEPGIDLTGLPDAELLKRLLG